MRFLKFRGWDNKKKKWLFMDGIATIFPHDWRSLNDVPALTLHFDDKNKILMQYTGLKDKNGTEIYEGDIVRKDGEYNGLVEYVWDKFRLNIWYEEDEWQPFTDRWTEYGEVIGNIYENPELVK